MPPTSATFGELLRQYRLAAGLTQEGLAERAGLSEHGIQKLERGATHPYRETAQRLELALQLEPDEQARFRAAVRPVRRHEPPPTLAAGGARQHNLPIPTTRFVARAGEIERVMQRLHEARLLTITGAGGCGKTRLAIEVAGQLVGDLADGVWLVDLARLTSWSRRCSHRSPAGSSRTGRGWWCQRSRSLLVMRGPWHRSASDWMASRWRSSWLPLASLRWASSRSP